MSKFNTPAHAPRVTTHGGVPAYPHLTPLQELRRSVLACLLWEDQFYESGQSIADRITTLAHQVSPLQLGALAVEARNEFNLRHAPLLLASALASHPNRNVRGVTKLTLANVIQRADELAEFLSLYWRNGKTPLAAGVKKGLAKAFAKFDAYQLAKYNRDGAIKLRDVLFMVHAKPKDEAQAALWKQLVDGTLPTPDTWEVELSAGKDKRTTFERLIRENNLGYLALLRNLRNMVEAGVNYDLLGDAIRARKGAQRILPFRYVAAARACPQLEPVLDKALQDAIAELPQLPGTTIVLVDVSGSMEDKLSAKSDLTRMDAAAALASMVNAEQLRVFSFSYNLKEVPPRRGMAGVDAITKSQQHGGTALAGAITAINLIPHDRLIVITDEQATDWRVPDPVCQHAYMVNVGSYQNGVGYGKWTNITGFSERILQYIVEVERANGG